MKIVYRGNFRPTFSTETHIAASLEAMGHTVVRMQEDVATWPECRAAAERAHMFLWTRTWALDFEGGHEALRQLAEAGVPTVSFHLDRYIGLDREAQIPDDPFWRTQFVFTADGGNKQKFDEYGVNHFWLPPAVFDQECRRYQPTKRVYPADVVFVGSNPYPHPEWRPYRDELLARLKERFGRRFQIYPRGRAIRGVQLNQLYGSSAVAIGDSCLSPDPHPLQGEPITPTHYWSDRIPETLGRGGLLIHPGVAGLKEWYTHAEHLLTYQLGDFDDLLGKVDWMLEDKAENERIRQAGHELVKARDTYVQRMQAVFDTVGAAMEWPVLPTPLASVSVRYQNQRPVTLHVRDGHPTDRQVIDEVWRDNTYPLERGDVQGRVVVDVGANIGAFSVLAASMGAKEVHAWEPEPGNAAVLRENVAGYPAVVVHEKALGGDSGHVSLVPGPEGAHGGGTHVGSIDDLLDGASLVEMEHVATGLPAGAIGLMKIDCEGGEYPIIEAMTDAELSRIDRIVMEFHGPHMPHLADAWPDGDQLDKWKAMVAKLADYGHTEIMGHPTVGGVIRWRRY